MINYIEYREGLNILAQQMLSERLVPIIGAGFSKDATAAYGLVPDAAESTRLMKEMIKKYVEHMDDDELEKYDFNETAKRMRKSVSRYIPEKEYLRFFKGYFTEVKLSETKRNFLRLPWLYAFTLNVDDGIDNTELFNVILPYQNARKNFGMDKPSLFKLHGDAAYEICYKQQNNIVFDSDQYTQSLISKDNQTMREVFSTAYKEFNLLFVGCSLKNEPDIKYIYNSIKEERQNAMGIILRTEKLSTFEEEDLEDYGITDVIIVKDYDVFYIDLYNVVLEMQNYTKTNEYPFVNPQIKICKDENLKFFSGYRCFDEKENNFYKSELIINRDCLEELEQSISKYNITFIEGRRFSGKTSLLCTFCEKEKRRTIFFFPSTTQESVDVIRDIIHNNKNSVLIFDSNAMSSECYYMLQDITDILKMNDNKIIVMINQSDNYLPELIEADYIKIKNSFSDKELSRLLPKSNDHALTERKREDTNLDYLNIIKKEQGLSLSLTLKLPKVYTKNEQILLLLLCVKDKVYSRDINSLGIKYAEIQGFIERISFLGEWIHTSRGEKSTFSAYKLVHNSKNVILEEVRKISHEDIVESIISIVKAFKHGDNNQKRIYREVMQFDTLNQLFGRKKGAGRLIFKVYENLELLLSDDLHFWLQRSKSIYRLVPNKYWKLKSAYAYAKKVYLDSENITLTTKAALSVSLISSLLYGIEKNDFYKFNMLEESIQLGHKAIFSDYYKQETRLKSDLNIENEHRNYAELIKNSCSVYLTLTHRNKDICHKAQEILRKLD